MSTQTKIVAYSFPRFSPKHTFEPSAHDGEKCEFCGQYRAIHPEHQSYRDSREPRRGAVIEIDPNQIIP
jgi:hypothetical protein